MTTNSKARGLAKRLVEDESQALAMEITEVPNPDISDSEMSTREEAEECKENSKNEKDQNSRGAEPDLTSIPAETMKLLTGAAVNTPFSCGTSTPEGDTPLESLFAQPAANTSHQAP